RLGSQPMEPIYFPDAEALRQWFVENHESAAELLAGYHKRQTGKPSPTWQESVDEALCFGWIDGIRRSVDADRYTQRFTPRRPRSNWSTINIARVEELTKQGRMRPAGLAAFALREEPRSGVYSYEQRGEARLDEAQEREFQADADAWAFFTSQPDGYRN